MSVVCYLIKPRGFCSGVSRAVNMANQVLKLYKEFYITEDIIHNKVFMDDMLARGARKVSSVEDIPDGSVVMFSTHGVSPTIVSLCEKKNLTIIDATCPIVHAIQKSIIRTAKEGKSIVIIGNKSHSEVIGLIGCAGNQEVFVVSNEADIEMLPDMTGKEVAYYTQTTLDIYTLDKIINALKEKIPHITSLHNNNICQATIERQTAINEIAHDVDVVIVVGSQHSSNTMRLVEIATKCGAKQVIRVDSKDDIDINALQHAKSLAITASASAPDYLVKEIVEYFSKKLDDVTIKNVSSLKQFSNE